MRTSYNREAFLQAASNQAQKLNNLALELQGVRRKHLERIAEVKRELEEASARLAELYLPDFQAATLQVAGMRIRQPQFARDMVARRDREEAALTSRLSVLGKDDRVTHANRYIHPDAGQLTQKLVEARGFLDTWQAVCQPYEGNSNFLRLESSGYAQPHYPYRWFQGQYYRDWRDGDEVLDALGKASWPEMLQEYRKASAERNRWQASFSEIQRSIDDVRDLGKEFADKTERLANLNQIMLEDARKALIETVYSLAPSILVEGAGGETGDPALVAQLARVSGLKAKLDYLKGLVTERLEPDGQALQQQIAGLHKDITKWRRPKMFNATIPSEQFEKRFRDPEERYHGRWEKVDRYSTTVYGFDAYDRVRLVDNFLWWDVMTDGRLDGNFLPQVREFHQSHPDYSYAASHDDERDAAMAAVLGERDEQQEWGDAS